MQKLTPSKKNQSLTIAKISCGKIQKNVDRQKQTPAKSRNSLLLRDFLQGSGKETKLRDRNDCIAGQTTTIQVTTSEKE